MTVNVPTDTVAARGAHADGTATTVWPIAIADITVETKPKLRRASRQAAGCGIRSANQFLARVFPNPR